MTRQAKTGAPFVLTTRRSPRGLVFTLIADNAAAARKLIDALVAQPQVREGVFVP
jgi:DNA-binding LacI/PurR family transcriptional regulator